MKMDGTGMGSLELYMLPENEDNFEKWTPIARFVGNQVKITALDNNMELISNFFLLSP